VRLLQNILLLMGATALGFGLGALALYAGMSSVLTQPRGENFGGGLIWVGLILCGGILGAFAGFGGAVRWIAQHESRIWSPLVWIGAALGVAVGLLVSFRSSGRLELWFWLVWAAFIVPACSAGGGLLAGSGVAMFKRAMKSR